MQKNIAETSHWKCGHHTKHKYLFWTHSLPDEKLPLEWIFEGSAL